MAPPLNPSPAAVANPPTRSQIAQWWLDNRLEDLARLFDGDIPAFLELRSMCWACHRHSNAVQRCHLIPRSLGGDAGPGNIALMCGDCHHAAPNVSDDGSTMLSWITDRPPFLFEVLWEIVEIQKDFDEAEVLAALRAFMSRGDAAVVLPQLVHRVSANAELHGGRFSPDTRRWIFREVFGLCVRVGRVSE